MVICHTRSTCLRHPCVFDRDKMMGYRRSRQETPLEPMHCPLLNCRPRWCLPLARSATATVPSRLLRHPFGPAIPPTQKHRLWERRRGGGIHILHAVVVNPFTMRPREQGWEGGLNWTAVDSIKLQDASTGKHDITCVQPFILRL